MLLEAFPMELSTKSVMTWKVKTTPAKRLIFRLSQSGPRTSVKELGLLPTITAGDHRNKSHRDRKSKVGLDLIGFICRENGVKSIRLKPFFGEVFEQLSLFDNQVT